MRKWWTVAALCALLIVSGCGMNRQEVIIDWMDFVQIQGKKYEGDHDAVLGDDTKLGQQLGEVLVEMDKTVKNPSYKMKDGDAAYLSVGSDIFAVQGHPDYVAVEDADWPNGYRLYRATGDPYTAPPVRETVQVAAKSVQNITLYSQSSPLAVLTGEEMQQFLTALKADQNPLTDRVGDGYYSVVFYTGETLVTGFRVHQSNGQADWMPNLDLDGKLQH